ncbi:hypothetical protein HDR66_02660, partial [bacterium]|nr:hypothetical protein [bacterium]
MLEYLRNAADKPVAKILIGILMFSFVGWGVAEWIFGNVVGDNVMVRVGDAKITASDFSTARSQELAQLSKEQQRAVYNDATSGVAFSERVLSKMTIEKMAANRAGDLGFMVSDHRIAREIREFPEFQYNGKFSTAMFDIVLRNSGYSEAQFADVMRAQVLRTMVLGALNVPVPVPEFAVDAAYNARYGMRDIEYATVKLSDFKVEKPTEEQLRDFYAQNPHVVEEVRNISYVLVPAKMTQPDAYDAALTTAQRVEDDIIAGETLANAASRHKARYVSHKNMSAANRPVDTILTDDIVAKIFAMDEGTESALIETPAGFVIIRVDSVVPRHNAEFDAVKSSLAADWTRA